MGRRFAASAIGAISAGLLLSAPATAAQSEEAGSPVDAVTGGKLLLNVRPRYEHVEQDGRPNDADAFTIRTLIGWETKPWHGLGLTVEGINVGHLFGESFNDTTNGKTQFPTVADPDDTDINQLYADYTGLADTRIRLGKQSIKLDNVRFVGNVEFRQVMQVFTGLTVANRSIPNTELYAAHLWRIKNVFAQQQQIRLEIAHADWAWAPGNHLVGYGYFLDQARTVSATGFADSSNRILGARADGGYAVTADGKLLYTAEYAKQEPYADGDSRVDADYNRLGAGAQWRDYFLRIDYERLSSNRGVYAFQTPLGTNHLFQGWADQFLTTPPQGLRDWYVSGGVLLWKVKLYSEYHRFKADFGDADYGNEFDFGATYKVCKGITSKLEFAYFTEGDPLSPATARKRDTQKIWLTLIYNFE
jgi:Alginate export